MPEATMICCDSSEWMRNGDFTPNRFDAQRDALSIICSAKTEQNHENTVGLISMGKNEKAEVLVNCTSDVGRILQAGHKMSINGKANILVALQTAQLALKHRKNKKQTQRIIVFVGSPVKCNEKLLIKAGKKLKKNNVAVDIVNFGEQEINNTILNTFLRSVNSNNNSSLINVASNTDILLSDTLVSSNLFKQQQSVDDLTGQPLNNLSNNLQNNNNNNTSNNNNVLNGIRREDDPELWEAIQQSLREEEQRQQQQVEQVTKDSQNDISNNNNNNSNDSNNNNNNNSNVDDDEELMRALQMSMMQDNENNNNSNNNNNNSSNVDISMNDSQMDDGDLLNELIDGLPGLNEDDVNVDELLGNLDDEDDNNDNNNNNNNNNESNKD